MEINLREVSYRYRHGVLDYQSRDDDHSQDDLSQNVPFGPILAAGDEPADTQP